MRCLLLSSLVVLALTGATPLAAQRQAPARWIADARTGCKVWNSEPQPRETVIWDGPCKGGIANGPGTLQWFAAGKLSMRQEGEWRNGRLEGRGLTIDAAGTRDEGEAVNGMFHGRGITTYADGTRVVGNFVEGRMQGRGVITIPNGGKIDADFVDGEAVRGVVVTAEGLRYEGELKDLKRHGKGKLLSSNGAIFEGDFVENRVEGYATVLYANGNRYEGEWRNNLPNGRGTSRIDGVANSGLWINGCLSAANSDRGSWSTVNTSAAACGFR